MTIGRTMTATPVDVLVGEHAEHRPGFRMEGHAAEIVGQHAGRLRVVGDVEHHRGAAPAAPGSGRAARPRIRPRRMSCIDTGRRSRSALERVIAVLALSQLDGAAQRRIGQPAAAPRTLAQAGQRQSTAPVAGSRSRAR
jgi:hypothetical protein